MGVKGGLWFGGSALVVFILAGRAPGVVDAVYSRRIYPLLASLLAHLTGWIPFSLAEWVFLILGLVLLAVLVRSWKTARRQRRGIIESGASAALKTLATFGWIWGVFLLLWGLNYQRTRPVALFELPPRPSREQAREWTDMIGKRLDLLRPGLEEDRRGVVVMPEDLRALDEEICQLQARALREMGLPPVSAGRTKTFLISPLLLRWGISGTYGPFTGEPNIVSPAPPGLLPAIVAHERAHLSGLAWEEAASFVGLRTLWQSEDPRLRYSAWLSLWLYVHPSVKGRVPAVQRDLRALAAFARRHRGWEAPAVRNAYSAYLRGHGVAGGAASYSRVADLALRYLQKAGMPPPPPNLAVSPPPAP